MPGRTRGRKARALAKAKAKDEEDTAAPVIYTNTANLAVALGGFIKALKADIAAYLCAYAAYEDGELDEDGKPMPEPPTFKTNRKTPQITIGPTIRVDAAVTKISLVNWTFYVHTKSADNDGNRALWLEYSLSPGCGSIYQALPIMIAHN